jgi:hypothetical protein
LGCKGNHGLPPAWKETPLFSDKIRSEKKEKWMSRTKNKLRTVLWIYGILMWLLLFWTYGYTQDVPNKMQSTSIRNMEITDGVRHSIPLDSLVAGGPKRDGIPSIDRPKFISIDEAKEMLVDSDRGIGLEAGGISRFYPFQILVWHEIVNDTIRGKKVLVTYCPLCESGIVFDPVVNGKSLEFGTSGKLWNSNLVMYDRTTDTLWSQILGEGVIGPMTGEKLRVLPNDQMAFGKWRAMHPTGKVLSADTGHDRPYGYDPYSGYNEISWTYFPVDRHDDRLHTKHYVVSVTEGAGSVSFDPEAVRFVGEAKKQVGHHTWVARFDEKRGTIRIYEKSTNGSLSLAESYGSYWFCWVAVHPRTELFTLQDKSALTRINFGEHVPNK